MLISCILVGLSTIERLVAPEFASAHLQYENKFYCLAAAAAHDLCNEIFRRWYDLEHEQARHTFVTVYDTTNNAVREEDLLRLGEKSLVLGYPAQARQLTDVLAA